MTETKDGYKKLLEYLRTLRDLHGDKPDYKYNSLEQFLLEEGTVFTQARLHETKMQDKMCFNSLNFALGNPGFVHSRTTRLGDRGVENRG